jgi:hypothetical protein
MFKSKRRIGTFAFGSLVLAWLSWTAFYKPVSVEKLRFHLQTGSISTPVIPTEPRSLAQQEQKNLVAQETKEPKRPVHKKPPRMFEIALARLHQDAVAKFVNAPGFGVSRFDPRWEGVPTKVIKEWKFPVWSTGELDQKSPVTERKDLNQIHKDSLVDFDPEYVSPPRPPSPDDGKTAVVSVEPVTMALVAKEKIWEIKSLDLVGLLKFKEPVVYISEKLPDMKDLKNVATRSLDLFDVAGLEALRKGEDIFARTKDDTIRMMGAVRADWQCLSCHDNKRKGDLLGAFSYTLRVGEYRLEHVNRWKFGFTGSNGGFTLPPKDRKPPVSKEASK